MSWEDKLTPAEKEQLAHFRATFFKQKKEQPLMSDKEFMAQHEASAEEYARGMVIPGMGKD